MTEYDATRRSEHSTLGDVTERYSRDVDAFTAGAQYALDTLLKSTDGIVAAFSPQLPIYLDGTASRILSDVHEGTL